MRYENTHFYYTRKPHGIATTFGNSDGSFLEQLIGGGGPEIEKLKKERSEGSEYGLINRLDNVTAGLLFFAKNQIIFHAYKEAQAKGKIQKIYYADLHGHINNNKVMINNPIYHHYSDNSRMTLEQRIGRGKGNEAETIIKPYYYDPIHNITNCIISINKGVRHQIRIHCASIGHHIIGDHLYCTKQFKKFYAGSDSIHLWSMGLLCEEFKNQYE